MSASLAGLRPAAFLAAFRHSFGISPMRYVMTQRLRLACSLLASTRQDITAIALATGFSSHSHLTAAFRQHFGTTPREYRAQVKGL
ncbi:helix-turn-helix transcriptional regulator [Dyella silvatica]|uniref:helix-turn-helix transcriptional regulator n=1 Tax=Dyella silvatica TaxID=2992128 RepID=UPI0022557C5A|nr:helix-turn-helix transcriptional regulator [Dyella silvatica]